MLKIRNRNNRNIRKRWYLSFGAVLLVSLLAAILVLYFSITAIDRQTKETNRAYLQVMAQTMEKQISGVQELSNTLLLSPDLALLRAVKGEISTDLRYKMFIFSQKFLKMIAHSSAYQFRFVYLKNSGRVLSDGHYSVAGSYYNNLASLSMPYDEFFKMLNEPHNMDYYPVKTGVTEAILCVNSLPGANEAFDCNVAVCIATQGILDSLKQASWQGDGIMYILDSKEQMLICSAPDQLLPEMLQAGNGEETLTINGNKYLSLGVESTASGLKYRYIALYDTIYEKEVYVRLLSFVSIASCFILGGMLIVLLVYMNYKPVRRIMSSFEDGSFDTGSQSEINEYEYILSRIVQQREEEQSVREQLKEKQTMLGRFFLLSFMEGSLPVNDISVAMMENYRISLRSARYAVVCVEAPDFYDSYGENIAENAAEVVEDAVCLGQPRTVVYHTMRSGRILLLIGMDEECPLEEIIRKAVHSLHADYQLNAAAGLSCESRDIQDIPMLFRQAETALEHTFVKEQTVVSYPEHTGKRNYVFRLEQESDLMDAVREGREEQAQTVLDTVLTEYGNAIDVDISQCLRFDLIAAYMRILTWTDGSLPRKYDKPERMERMVKAAKVTDVIGLFKQTVHEVCVMRNENAQNGKGIVEYAEDYVRKHLHEQTLDVAEIADNLHTHPSHLSRVFKEKSGVGLLEFINRNRVEYASQLLLTSNWSVTRIAEECGFTSGASFIRVFKQYKGITPGQYRTQAIN